MHRRFGQLIATHSLVDFTFEIQANTPCSLALIGAGMATTVSISGPKLPKSDAQ